ncbi:hydroxylase [Sorangium sp. So ce341]
MSRNPGRAKFPDGVEAVAGDLAAPETFAAAFEGVDALHLINFGGDDCAPLQTGEQLVALARQAGARRITVLLGGSSTPLDAAVAAGGIGWTLPSAGGVHGEPPRVGGVDPRRGDCARAVLRPAERGGPRGRRRRCRCRGADPGRPRREEVHAHRAGGAQRAREDRLIAAAAGREIQLVELTEQQARERWAAAGFSPEAIEFFVEVYGNTPKIGYTVVPTVARVTGRPARTFARWAREHAAAFAGSPGRRSRRGARVSVT